MASERLIGVDIGGTGIKLGLVEVQDAAPPRIVASRVLTGHAEREPADVLSEVSDLLRALLAEAGWSAVRGVGVGCAGLVDRARGTVAVSPNLPAWEGAPLAALLSRALPFPIVVDNDVNAFTLAECLWGAARGARHVVFLTLGTGVGGGFLVDGRLLRGAVGFAGEPGHGTLVLGGIPCACGNEGCAERYLGNRDLVLAARRHPGAGTDPLVQDPDLTPLGLTRAAGSGSPVARDVLTQAGRALGGLLVTLVNVFNPERVVIGGGVAQAGSFILDPAREHLLRHSLVARWAPPEILAAALGPEAGLLGAAALVQDGPVRA